MSTPFTRNLNLAVAAAWLALGLPSGANAQEAVPDPLTLQGAVEYAVRNSPTLKSAASEVSAARSEAQAAWAKLRPQASANGFLSKGSMPSILSAMGSDPASATLGPATGFVDLNFTLMVPIHAVRLANLASAASHRERAAAASGRELAAEVALRVREAYIEVLLAAEWIRSAQARIQSATEMVRTAQAMVDSGKGIDASVRRAEAELAEANQDLAMAEGDRRKRLLDLLEEMGADLEASPKLADGLEFRPLEGSLDSFLAQAKQKRGELASAHEKARSAAASVSAAKSASAPQVYGFAMADAFKPKDMSGSGAGYTFGLTVSLPVFDGGMRRSEVHSAKAMAASAEAEIARIELAVAKQVRQAWIDVETAARNVASAQAALSAAQAAHDVISLRVAGGKGILLEQLDSLAALTRARTNLAKASATHRIAVARLLRAVGSEETLG